MSHQPPPWDPYAHSSEIESGTQEDNTDDHGNSMYFGGDARVRPMGSLYAATTTRPGAQQVNRPAQHHPQSPTTSQRRLMYEPRNTAPHPYVNYQLPPQEERPLPSQQQQYSQRNLGRSSRNQSARTHQTAPVVGMAGYPGTYDDGIGVGLMISASTEEDEENAYQQQASSPVPPRPPVEQPYGGDFSQAARVRPPVPIQTMPLPTLKQVKPPLPDYKPMEPPKPNAGRNRRFLHIQRVPDVAQGMLGGSTIKKGNHVVTCESCHASCQTRKCSVLVKCPKCEHVGPSTPINRKHAPIMR